MSRLSRSEASLRRQTAYHEAGHAVVGWVFGLRTTSLRVLENGDGAADVLATADVSELDEIAVAASGPIAGNMCGEPHRHAWYLSSDWRRAYNAACHAHPEDEDAQERLMRSGSAKARRLLHQHWTLVERIGTELHRRNELSEEEVDAMMRAGLGFIPENGAGAGIRFRDRKAAVG